MATDITDILSAYLLSNRTPYKDNIVCAYHRYLVFNDLFRELKKIRINVTDINMTKILFNIIVDNAHNRIFDTNVFEDMDPYIPIKLTYVNRCKKELKKLRYNDMDVTTFLAKVSRACIEHINWRKSNFNSQAQIPIVRNVHDGVIFQYASYKQKIMIKTFNQLKSLYKSSIFNVDVLIMLMTYDTIPSYSMQASLPDAIYEFNKKHYGQFVEMFASPMNTHVCRIGDSNDEFCGAFPHNKLFGSIGNAFNLENCTKYKRGIDKEVYLSGFFSAGPPYHEVLAGVCAHYIIEQYDRFDKYHNKEDTTENLVFMFAHSHWPDAEFHEVFTKSKYCQLIMIYEKFEHSYISGMDYLGADNFVINFASIIYYLSYKVLDEDEKKKIKTEIDIAFKTKPST